MKAYKCDVCGYYCNDVFKIEGFDVYPGDKKIMELKTMEEQK